MKYYPVLLNVKDLSVLVVGGGRVALRKIKGLRSCRAHVRVVAENIIPEIKRMTGVRWEERAFRLADLKGVHLVIAATSCGKMNRRVFDGCRRRGLFVNVVDDSELSTFILPAVVRRGDLLISVSTQGAAPFVSGELARRMRAQYGDSHALWVKKLKDARRRIRKSVSSPAVRRRLLEELLRPVYFKIIEKGETKAFDRKVRELINEAR